MLLKDYRKNVRKLSMQKAAAEIGVHWTTLYRWETGRATPLPDQIRSVEAWSKGRVRANDFIKAAA